MAVVLHSLTNNNVLVARSEFVAPGKVASDIVVEIDRMCKVNEINLADCTIVVDRSAAGFIEELKRASKNRIIAKQSRSDNKMDRVRLVYSLAQSGAIVYDPKCRRLISNCKTVKWKTIGKREDIVGDDHAFDAHLYAAVEANVKHRLFERTEVDSKAVRDPDDEEEDDLRARVKRELERIRP